MKLSEAMEVARKKYVLIRNDWVKTDNEGHVIGACALGMVCLSCASPERITVCFMDGIKEILAECGVETDMSQLVDHPANSMYSPDTLAQIIVELVDYQRWDIDRIINWLKENNL